MKRAKNPSKASPSLTKESRFSALHRMQHCLIQEHEIACHYLTHLSTQPDIAEHTPEQQRLIIQTGLEKYATITQKMLSILEKLTDHESALQTLIGEDKTSETPPTEMQWDMLIRHAHKQLKTPLLPHVPISSSSSLSDDEAQE